MQKNNWKAFTEITIIDDLTIFHFEFHNITYLFTNAFLYDN